MCPLVRLVGALRVFDATRHIDTHQAGRVVQSSGLDDKVFQRHVVRIGILTGAGHLTRDGHRPPVLKVMYAGDVEHVVAGERHVGAGTFHDAADVKLEHLVGQVVTLAIEHGTIEKSVACQSVRLFDELAYSLHFPAQLVDSRPVDRSAHFQFVFEAVEYGIDRHHVAVTQLESRIITPVDRGHLILLPVLPHHAHSLRISISREPSGIT